MLPLPFNSVLPPTLRIRYQVALGVLPLALMFSIFIPLILFAPWLESAMGIPPDAPLKSQPNGGLFFAIFLTVTLVGMLLGYLFGWLCNAAIARYVLGWSASKTRSVYMHSDVPEHWLKGGAV